MASERLVNQDKYDIYISTGNTLITLKKAIEFQAKRKIAHRVLEPSAGNGAIVDLLKAHFPKVYALDIVPGRPDIKQGDILTTDFGNKKFTLIVANPPFKGWEQHLKRYLSLLSKCNGQLTIVLPKNEQQMRDWFDKNHTVCLQYARCDGPANDFLFLNGKGKEVKKNVNCFVHTFLNYCNGCGGVHASTCDYLPEDDPADELVDEVKELTLDPADLAQVCLLDFKSGKAEQWASTNKEHLGDYIRTIHDMIVKADKDKPGVDKLRATANGLAHFWIVSSSKNVNNWMYPDLNARYDEYQRILRLSLLVFLTADDCVKEYGFDPYLDANGTQRAPKVRKKLEDAKADVDSTLGRWENFHGVGVKKNQVSSDMRAITQKNCVRAIKSWYDAYTLYDKCGDIIIEMIDEE